MRNWPASAAASESEQLRLVRVDARRAAERGQAVVGAAQAKAQIGEELVRARHCPARRRSARGRRQVPRRCGRAAFPAGRRAPGTRCGRGDRSTASLRLRSAATARSPALLGDPRRGGQRGDVACGSRGKRLVNRLRRLGIFVQRLAIAGQQEQLLGRRRCFLGSALRPEPRAAIGQLVLQRVGLDLLLQAPLPALRRSGPACPARGQRRPEQRHTARRGFADRPL